MQWGPIAMAMYGAAIISLIDLLNGHKINHTWYTEDVYLPEDKAYE